MGKSKMVRASSGLHFACYLRFATWEQCEAGRATAHSAAQPEEVMLGLKKTRETERQGQDHDKHSSNAKWRTEAGRHLVKAPVIPFKQRIFSVGPPRHLIRHHRRLSRR